MKKRIGFVLAFVATAVVAGGVGAYSVSHLQEPVPQPATKVVEVVSDQAGTHFTSYSAEKYPDLTYAAENAVKAVVSVVKTEEIESRYGSSRGFEQFFEFFGFPQEGSYQEMPRERMSGGSGVIISGDGYIVTNNHVIENASKLRVKLNDGRMFDAEIVGSDPTTDVALIKIDAKDLPTLPFGSSDDLRLGEWVLAIGSPYELQSTVTAGIVSAKARSLGVIPSEFRIESFIQPDAAVNPGNSGGALVNTKGELVGINTVIKSPTGSYAGYSFAVPEAIVRKVIMDLKEYGIVQRALLGIAFVPLTSEYLEETEEGRKLDVEPGGIYVAEVTAGGAAEAAGIERGDIITEMDGVKVDDGATVSEIVGKHRPNDRMTVTVKRGNKVKQIEVVLRNKAGKTELVSKDDFDIRRALGGEFRDVTDRQAKALNLRNGGVTVVTVTKGGILSQARVREGYVITRINDTPIRSVRDLDKITEKVTSIEGVYPDGRSMSYALIE